MIVITAWLIKHTKLMWTFHYLDFFTETLAFAKNKCALIGLEGLVDSVLICCWHWTPVSTGWRLLCYQQNYFFFTFIANSWTLSPTHTGWVWPSIRPELETNRYHNITQTSNTVQTTSVLMASIMDLTAIMTFQTKCALWLIRSSCVTQNSLLLLPFLLITGVLKTGLWERGWLKSTNKDISF